MSKFQGTGVAIITPFDSSGAVDHEGLKNLIDFIIDGGVEYIVSLGTTGETATLNDNEKKAVWETTIEQTNKRVPLVAGIGGNNTASVLRDIKELETSGFDAVLSVCPYYNKPTQEGIYQHYRAVSESSELPIILYNVPGRTGINISAETTIRLASDFKNIVGTKEASGNFEQFNQIFRDMPDDFLFISGDDPVTLPLIAMGASGVISVVANALPGIFSTMVRLCLDGKFLEAQGLHYSLVEITRLFFTEGNPAGVKAALKIMGLCDDTVRLPLVSASEGLESLIRQELLKLRMLR